MDPTDGAGTLLLADPASTIQRLVELTFAGAGIKVVCVSDGQQAIDFFNSDPPDAALISVGLQKHNGYDVAAYVRARPELQRIPVLLLAGAFDIVDEDRVRESGAAGVLIKPLEPGPVIKRVKELLGMSTPERDAAGRPTAAPGRLVTSREGPPAAPSDLAPPSPGPLAPTAPEAPKAEVATEGRPAAPAGPRPDARPTGSSAPSSDYFDHLEAAFESLDSQLAGRAAPGHASATLPAPRVPAAVDPDRRPTASEPSPPPDEPPDPVRGAKPVFEVDAGWFGPGTAGEPQRPAESATPGEVDGLVDGPAPEGAPGEVDIANALEAASARRTDGVLSPAPEPAEPSASDPPETTRVIAEVQKPASPPVAPAAPVSAVPPADAFAFLLAEEQGEPLPQMPYPSLELSDDVLGRLADQVADKIAGRIVDPIVHRLAAPVAERVAAGLANPVAERLEDPIVERLTAPVADRLSGPLTEQVSDSVARQLAEPMASRLIEPVADRLSGPMAERVAANIADGVADRVAAQVAEQLAQGVLGQTLRDTVKDVSEQLVRDEIARIRSLAQSKQA